MRLRVRSTRVPIRLSVFCALLLSPFTGLAGDLDREPEKEPGNSLIPLPVAFYSPETELGFGAAALYIFRGDDTDSAGARPNQLQAFAVYTTRRQFTVALGAELHPGHQRNRLGLGLSGSEFPTFFFGIGNETSPDVKEEYTPQRIGFTASGLRTVAGPLRAGVTVEVQNLELLKTEPGGSLDSGIVSGTEGGWANGAGLVARLDSRTGTFSPQRGDLVQLWASAYGRALGSDYSYERLGLDARKYFPARAGWVVAVRFLGDFVSGRPPFYSLPRLGGSNLLRGYFEGRFTDGKLLALQTELRFPLVWRMGGIVFLSAGQVAPHMSSFRIDAVRPSAGFGLRFTLDRKENVRLRTDWGWGEDESGFYFGINEAF
jgi:outer membrane protein assembly factor BamA